ARGGAARAEVIISDSPINFPRVNNANLITCLTQEAYNKFYAAIRPGGLLITDSDRVATLKKVDARQVELPLYQSAVETIGNPVVLNICMLGAVVNLSQAVRSESVIRVLEKRLPDEYIDLNRRAFQLGIELGQQANNQ
ncbi:MAG: 2-oxoacid:acceptor oxidoreductase family protein, partial [Desulfosudaceae bacterium]